MKGIFTLNWASVIDAVLTSIIVAVLAGLVGVVSTAGFNIFTAPWGEIGQNMLNWGFIAGVLTLGKEFLTTDEGSLLGMGPKGV